MLYFVLVEDEFDSVMYIAPKYMSFSRSNVSVLTLSQSMSSCSLFINSTLFAIFDLAKIATPPDFLLIIFLTYLPSTLNITRKVYSWFFGSVCFCKANYVISESLFKFLIISFLVSESSNIPNFWIYVISWLNEIVFSSNKVSSSVTIR